MAYSTIFVKFKSAVGESTVEECLHDLGIWGVKVSTMGMRYAVEVPVGQEQSFIQKLSEDPLVDRVNPTFLAGNPKPAPRQFVKKGV